MISGLLTKLFPDTTKGRLRKSGYEPKYPYNKAMVTESGHEVHIDDTPGKERIRIAHKSGTYDEVIFGGHKASYVVGNNQEYNKSGKTVTVDENYDIKIHGHQRVLIGGGSHTEITGDGNITIGSDANVVIVGSAKIAVAGDCYLGVQGQMNMNVKANINMEIGGNWNASVGGSMNVKAAQVNIDAPMNINGDIQHSGNMTTSGVHTDSLGHHV